MSDATAYLSRAIEQGQGLAEADVVVARGRIFNLVGDELSHGCRNADPVHVERSTSESARFWRSGARNAGKS